jgi:hypothetical protein
MLRESMKHDSNNQQLGCWGRLQFCFSAFYVTLGYRYLYWVYHSITLASWRRVGDTENCEMPFADDEVVDMIWQAMVIIADIVFIF